MRESGRGSHRPTPLCLWSDLGSSHIHVSAVQQWVYKYFTLKKKPRRQEGLDEAMANNSYRLLSNTAWIEGAAVVWYQQKGKWKVRGEKKCFPSMWSLSSYMWFCTVDANTGLQAV